MSVLLTLGFLYKLVNLSHIVMSLVFLTLLPQRLFTQLLWNMIWLVIHHIMMGCMS